MSIRIPRRRFTWAGYLACGWGLVFAAISFYWGGGGTLGLDTIGGSIEAMGRARDPLIVIAAWVTGFVKVVGAALALALVSDWGTRLPRRPLMILGWAAAGLLTLYGGVQVLVEALVATGLVHPAEPVAWKPLLWHLYVWDLSFLIWGLLFGLATWHFRAFRDEGRVSDRR